MEQKHESVCLRFRASGLVANGQERNRKDAEICIDLGIILGSARGIHFVPDQ